MFNFSFDPEQFASLGSSFDEPDPFAPTPVALVKPTAAPVAAQPITQKQAAANSQALADKQKAEGIWEAGQKGVGSSVSSHELPNQSDITFDSGAVYDTTEEALGGFASFLGGLDTQYQDTTNKYGLTQFDPSDYLRSGLSGPRALGTNASKDALNTYVKDNNIPLTQERDGVTYHLTGGNDRNNDALHGRVRDGIWQDQGPVGTYSTVYIDTSTSLFQDIINNPVVNIAANFVPFGTAVLTAAKAANGQTLHGTDYLSAGVSAAKGLGMLQAPATAAEAQKIGEVAAQSGGVMAGPIAENAALAGKGLTLAGKTLSYNQSVGLLTAAATGDPKSALVSIYGGDLIKGGLNKAGVTSEALAKVGIPAAAFEAGLQKTVEKVAAGEEFDDALAYGFVDYAREGGLKNLFNMPESDISFAGIEDVVRDIVRPIGTAATAVAKFVKESVPDIDTSAIRQAGRTAEDLVRAGGSAIDDAVIQPVREIAKDLDDAVFRPAGDALSAADTAIREVLSEADTAARRELTKLDEGLYDIQSPFSTPDIDLPSIDLPSIDLPNFNLPSLGMGMGMLLSGAPAPTATTGKIFENELFKFKNKIELTEFGPLNQPEQEVDIEDFLTSPFESAFTTSQRFA